MGSSPKPSTNPKPHSQHWMAGALLPALGLALHKPLMLLSQVSPPAKA